MELLVLFGVMFFFMALGTPIFVAMLLAVLATLFVGGLGSATVLPTQMAAGVDSYELLAIPFFILMGELMYRAGLTERIVDLLMFFLGRVRGGLAYTVVASSAFASSVSGSAPAAASMIGSAMLPLMGRSGYKREFSAAVTASSAVLGPVFPPSVPFIFVALVTGLSVGQLFLGGVGPAIIMVTGLVLTVYVMAPRGRTPSTDAAASSRDRSFATLLVRALPSLLTPALILVGVVSGFATITEVSILASLYVLVLGLAYRSLSIGALLSVFKHTAQFGATILMIFAAVGGFTYVVATLRLGEDVSDFVARAQMGPITFLLATMVFFVVLGLIMDAIPAILIFLPVLLPAAIELGIDPVHYSVAVVVNLMMGLITPPVGALLYVVTKLARVDFAHLVRECGPFLAVYGVTLVLVTFLPFISTAIPEALF
ncbi:TRAP transporter large permease [Ornithinimicrobium cavernae]|uniref:TRAP transporter large permease n=1 Tax=Ornithinimicrobium cavernae TaxID=2666047 RepID=UPI000D68FFC6|nr:TRAP transporter large permease [Ornithinimicrobium cavernae]